MSLEVSVNINSLRMVGDELAVVIKQSADEFESYLGDRENSALLSACTEKLSQLGGTFRLLQFPGVAQLADEMAALLAWIAQSGKPAGSAASDALTYGFFILPRYLEYVTTRQRELPILLAPYVNQLRMGRKQPLLAEWEFCQGGFDWIEPASSGVPDNQPDLSRDTVARLRHMYQVGLLGVVTEKKGSHFFPLMQRSLSRVGEMLGHSELAALWQMAEAVVEAFAQGGLSITLNRKRTLAEFDKMMRVMATQDDFSLAPELGARLKKDLLFLLALASNESEAITDWRQRYQIVRPELDDAALNKQRSAMHGPSFDTIESVVKVLNEELRSVKDILEIGSQNNAMDAEDFKTLHSVLARVADTLSVLGLQGPGANLKEQLAGIAQWQCEQLEPAQVLEVADAVLYVESALSGLDRREFSLEELNEATALARRKIIASNHLAEAEALVLEEAQTGIALAKRAISAYVESKFDIGHIANVAVSLNTVRGGLYILGYGRAAAILKSAIAFVDAHMSKRTQSGQHHQLLETLADALISLEYYLGELTTSHKVNDKILDVAEESLAALGYKVQE